MITISGVEKNFGSTRVLRGIDLSVARGELVSLLGPSGCGKTTLLRCLAGLETIDKGEIRIEDTVVSGRDRFVPPDARNVGMIFQSYALWPHMTVADNVAYALRLRKRPLSEIRERVQEALRIVGLEGFEERYPAQLSGGQQQRVALARAIAMRPKVLLFDEPLSNLDAQLRERMRIELRSLQQSLGITAVYVTHDQAEAMAISDRIVLMREGSVVQVGSPAVMYRQPATAYAADFLGSVNFIPARYDGEGRTQMILASDKAVPLTISLPREVSRGSRVLLGIRPEDVLINERGDVNTFRAKVVNAVFLGASWHVELSLEGTRIRASVPSRGFPEGVPEECTVTLSPSRLMYIPVDDMGVLPGENR